MLTPHPADTIVDDLKTVFTGIYNVSLPIPDSDNAGSVESLFVASGGLYNADVSRSYIIAITKSGISGVAECSVTDSLGTDNRTGVVITSGAEISVGTLGAKITFEFTGELTLGDSWLVQCKHDFYTNVKHVQEADPVPTEVPELPAIVFLPQRIPYELNGSSAKYRCDMVVAIELWIKQHNSLSIRSQLFYALKDLEHAIAINQHIAKDMRIINAEFDMPVPGSPFAAVSVEIGIWFDNYIT